MESLHRILLLSLLLPFVASFTPNASIFLDCGSTSSVHVSSDSPPRTFVSDSNYVSGTNTYAIANPNTSIPHSIYTKARVFTSTFTYRLTPLVPKSSNLLRLHFFPFSNLSSARFDVTASNYLLLSNFSVSTNSPPTIKEFFLWINSDLLEVQFSPQQNFSAFVSAIEAFTAPTELLSNPNPTILASAAFNGSLKVQAMETMYRVNMGGPLVTPENDTLWRTWVPDDDFLYDEATSSTNSTLASSLQYQSEGSSEEIGPPAVYDTARVVDVSEGDRLANSEFTANVTWSFKVDLGYHYLVRMHFCDIISSTISMNGRLFFTIYIMNYASMTLLFGTYSTSVKEPFYQDFVVYTEESSNINISINLFLPKITSALLNGLEIMKMNNSFLSLNGAYNPSTKKISNKKKIPLVMILGFGSGAIIVIASIVLCIIFAFHKRQSQKPEHKSEETPGFTSTDTSSNSGGASQRLNLELLISFEHIKLATHNFDENSVIGVGGFGKVYKGILNDGTRVAVKRAMARSNQGFPEFQTEIVVLSQIRHRHLVSLIGYCNENSEMILVYEYMEKGTLRSHLYGSNLPSLSWKQRLEICIGAAKGLHYLHTSFSQNIIHRDVKSSNILLGKDFLTKVSDFGLSKLGPSLDQSHVSTAVKGSFGYLDLEYVKTQKLTDKSDVYSFGVTLFEVLCARPVIDESRDEISFTEWAIKWQKKGNLEKIIDPTLLGEINEKSLTMFGEIAAKCLKDYGIERPSIGEVLWNLEYCLQLQEIEVRRNVHEDSGTSTGDFPVVRRMPSSIVSSEGIRDVDD